MLTIIPTLLETSRETIVKRMKFVELRAMAPVWQIDVLDGSYGGAVSFFEPDTLHELATHPQLPPLHIELDLMTDRPLDYLAMFSEAEVPVARATVHIGAVKGAEAMVKEARIRYPHIALGVALALDEPIELLDHLASQIQYAQVMGVPVGAKGQPFDERSLETVRAIRHAFSELNVSVDGGARLENAHLISLAGADRLCVNSALWSSQDPLDTMRKLTAY